MLRSLAVLASSLLAISGAGCTGEILAGDAGAADASTGADAAIVPADASAPSPDASKGSPDAAVPAMDAALAPADAAAPAADASAAQADAAIPADPSFVTVWTNDDWAPLVLEEAIQPDTVGASITIGATAQRRSPGTQSVHYLSDANTSRSELHSAKNFLGVGEGSTVFFGWSDYYVTVPIHSYTVFQWRDEDEGFTGCPVIQFAIEQSYWDLDNVNGIVVQIKEGQAAYGAIVPNIEADRWYDFVVGMKYAKDGTGFFTVWAGAAGTLRFDAPTFEYSGPTMYGAADLSASTCPCDYSPSWGDQFHSPQLRMGGAYMWGTTAEFESFKGPLRINLDEAGQTAFDKVLPR